MFENINFYPGVVTFNEDDINKHSSIKDLIICLRDDLFMVEYPSKFLIDVGWYNFDDDWHKKDENSFKNVNEVYEYGEFAIKVVKNEDWENLIHEYSCKTLEELYELMKEAVEVVRKLSLV